MIILAIALVVAITMLAWLRALDRIDALQTQLDLATQTQTQTDLDEHFATVELLFGGQR